MPIGLAIPVGVNSQGGASLVKGNDNNEKIIKLALSSDDNENAFQQDIGLGQLMIFDINDMLVRSKILRRITFIFDIFKREKRYELLRNTIKWDENQKEGELTLEFKYRDMESDEEFEFRRAFNIGD